MESTWFKSSHSQTAGDCIEIAPTAPRAISLRDSKNPAGPALTVPARAFGSFVAALKGNALH
jgi:hypothetical protein